MPKFPTFPILYDSVLQLSITKLKEWKYLEPNKKTKGVINWSINGNPTGSISIIANTVDKPFIELDYKYRDEPRNYKIQLVSVPSNLGKGLIWYFFCPQTNKRCRKMYSIGGYFLHREAFKGCMYDCQTQSKYYRWIDKNYGAYFKADKCYSELYKKHFKPYYAGKPTKKYLKLMKQIEKAQSIPYSEIEKMFL
jgi:hypothetical protein